jgi:hypothetical protein
LAGPLAAAAGFGLLLLPGARRLPSYHPTRYHGVENMRDAVNACRQTGLQGWDLVAYAQKLVSHKFAVYSTLNLWDPPNRAFIYGMGYCTQYNLALKNLLRRLGFAPEAVFAMKVRVFDNEAWTMGHTWLRVTIDGETRAVCAGRIENEPGKVSFVPLSPVRAGHPLTLFLTHVGLIFFVGFLEWRALLTGSQPPDWSYRPRLPAASQAQT